jgi:hypothetical protein
LCTVIGQGSHYPGKPGKVREFYQPGKVREKSGNFISSQGIYNVIGISVDIDIIFSVGYDFQYENTLQTLFNIQVCYLTL